MHIKSSFAGKQQLKEKPFKNLERGQYPFQPIKFVNLVVPNPCETEPYNNRFL